MKCLCVGGGSNAPKGKKENPDEKHESTQLDAILSSSERELLTDAGSVSHEAAMEKAHAEYRKYQQKTLSPVEEAYLQSLKAAEKEVKAETKKEKKSD